MKILVFIKQIPDVNAIKLDPQTNRIVREGVPLLMNSFDKKAVEEAIRLKEKYGAVTMVASMGPPQASDVLNEALRMGIDRAALLSDRKFGGSDTLATSKILSEFARKIDPDLILTGKYSLDGETSQVPPEISEFLGYALLTSVSRIEELSGDHITVERDVETGTVRARAPIPAVVSVSEKINKARAIKPETSDLLSNIELFDSVKIGLDITGSDYSPTVVMGTKKLELTREVHMLDFNKDVYMKIMDIISQNTVISGEPDEIELPPPVEGHNVILSVAMGDLKISEEITSKCAEMALKNNLNTAIFGNISQENSRTLVGSTYYHVSTRNTDSLAEYLHRFILENRPRYIIFPSSIDGRDLAGKVAAKMHLGLTADCIDLEIIEGRLIQYKPAFGGNVVASIYSRTDPQMATVRPGMFRKRYPVTPPEIVELRDEHQSRIEVLEEIPTPPEYPSLDSRDVVIGFGRGLKNKNFIGEIMKLATGLKAAVGATRPMIDMKFIPRQQQIGLTGSSISPAVYLNLGVSGQPNHVVGIRYSRKIISVNTDPNAHIFKYSDYGVVADLNEFVEGFNAFLSQ